LTTIQIKNSLHVPYLDGIINGSTEECQIFRTAIDGAHKMVVGLYFFDALPAGQVPDPDGFIIATRIKEFARVVESHPPYPVIMTLKSE
jgi:hypothetical protein